MFIVLEYVTGGVLYDFCKERGALGEDAGRFFLHQMIDTLDYMHSRFVVHRDIKLENILLDK